MLADVGRARGWHFRVASVALPLKRGTSHVWPRLCCQDDTTASMAKAQGTTLLIPKIKAVLAKLAQDRPLLLAELARVFQPGAALDPGFLTMMQNQLFAAIGVLFSAERGLGLQLADLRSNELGARRVNRSVSSRLPRTVCDVPPPLRVRSSPHARGDSPAPSGALCKTRLKSRMQRIAVVATFGSRECLSEAVGVRGQCGGNVVEMWGGI